MRHEFDSWCSVARRSFLTFVSLSRAPFDEGSASMVLLNVGAARAECVPTTAIDPYRSSFFVSFSDLGVPADLVAALAALNITEPFPIQAATIADALAGRDVCGKAPTGSGKTLAFGVPLVARVPKAKPRRPRALVLAPTRELAAQIQKELQPLAAARGMRVFSVYGGVSYEPQKRAMRNGVEILVACPGRLEDLIEQRAVRLDAVEIMVIDEADRMADMGFMPSVCRLLDQTAEDRQTILFSATLDGDIAVLTREYQNSPVRHEVEAPEDDWALAEHIFEDLGPDDRIDRAAAVIDESGPTIVFTHTRRGADRVAQRLSTAGVAAAPIHGGLSQARRDKALHAFRKGHVAALIATDVAARGIHVNDVACVLHFDPPVDTKTYVHRSGRTARAGAAGKVVSFVTRDQRKASLRLRRELGLGAPAEGTSHRSETSENHSAPSRNRSPQGRSFENRSSEGRSNRGRSSEGRREGGFQGRSNSEGRSNSNSEGRAYKGRSSEGRSNSEGRVYQGRSNSSSSGASGRSGGYKGKSSSAPSRAKSASDRGRKSTPNSR